jgi:hypothetical protein
MNQFARGRARLIDLVGPATILKKAKGNISGIQSIAAQSEAGECGGNRT